MNADEKKLVRQAIRHGAQVEVRNTHVRVLDANGEFVIRLSVGTALKHDTQAIRREWKRRGWL